MKISDVIKLPVEERPFYNLSGEMAAIILRDATKNICDLDPHKLGEAQAIAHAINSHDKLVTTLVTIKNWGGGISSAQQYAGAALKEFEGIE